LTSSLVALQDYLLHRLSKHITLFLIINQVSVPRHNYEAPIGV